MLAVLLLSAGCRRLPPPQERLTIVASFLPVYLLTANVAQGVPGVSVEGLLPPAAGCPHDYMMTTSEAALLDRADVLVLNGLGMEQFLDRHPIRSKPGVEILELGQAVDPIRLEGDLPEHDGHFDPHAWVSPAAAAQMTRHLGRELARIDSAHAAEYLANAELHAARLDSLGKAFRDLVARAPNRRVVTFHGSFGYLARDSGLEIIAVIEPAPGVEPSAGDLARLAETIRREQPAAIIGEPQYSDRLVKMLSDETGVPVHILDPVATGSSDPDAYYSAMEANLRTLAAAL